MNAKISEYLKALADPNRLKLMELLIRGETCSCTLINKLPITQPTLSYHLNLLANAKLTTTKRDGNKIEYFVNREAIDEIINYLEDLKNMENDSCKL